MTRCFVAVGLPCSLRDALAAALEAREVAFEGLRRTEPAAWHVTLAFLGEVEDTRLDDVAEVVRGAVTAAPLPDHLEVAGAGAFGDGVLWAGVGDEPSDALSRCAAVVQDACARAGLDVVRRPLRAHLTIARSRRSRPVGDDDVAELGSVIAGLDAGVRRFRPETVDVMTSRLGRGPARYAVSARVPAAPD